jgi:hypothetical protein
VKTSGTSPRRAPSGTCWNRSTTSAGDAFHADQDDLPVRGQLLALFEIPAPVAGPVRGTLPGRHRRGPRPGERGAHLRSVARRSC